MGFDSYHPAILLAFFTGAIVFCVIVQQPLFQAAGFVSAALCLICLRGREGWKTVAAMLAVAAVLACLNPLFNTGGETVLFRYFGGRPYTLQALAYGASTGCMFATVMLWFACYNRMVTSDKLTYLFGGIAPAVTLTLTMVLRLVPGYQRKGHQIALARSCIGKSPSCGGLRQRAEGGALTLSALTTWALEGAVTTADSMRSRGYGAARRTSFAKHRFGARDAVAAAVLAVCAAVAIACLLGGGAAVQYIPVIAIPPLSPLGWAGFAAFLCFMLLPSAIQVKEALTWNFLRSRI